MRIYCFIGSAYGSHFPDGQTGGHAGKGETSVLWALEPDCVDLSRLPDPDAPGSHFAMGDDAPESDRRVGELMVKVFDVLSEVLYDTNLSQLLLDAAANARDLNEILQEISIEVDEEYIASVKENLGESLATHYIDYTRIQEMTERAREQRLIPEYTEAFFRRALSTVGGTVRERRDGFLAVESVPLTLRRLAEEGMLARRRTSIARQYPRVTFDKQLAFQNPDAEFLCFGHPLFEIVLTWVERETANSLQQGAVFTDPDGNLDGVVAYYEGEIRDGTEAVAGKRLFAFYVDAHSGEVRKFNPAFLWDLAESDQTVEPMSIESLKTQVFAELIPTLEEYRHELAAERDRQADIKRKYGLS